MYIYVTDIKAKEKLEELGYVLVGTDHKRVWVFENNSELVLDDFDAPYVLSDSMIFVT